jgi:hypothetical protein
LKIASRPAERARLRKPSGTNSANRETGTGSGFAASKARETGKKAEMRCDMA